MKSIKTHLIFSPFIKILPILIFFLATLYTPKDFDLGWHLKYGEYLVNNHKILDTNIYSTSLSGYKWTSSSWALDPILYLVFDNFGFAGLSILGAIVTTLIYYIICKSHDLKFFGQATVLIFLFVYLNPVISDSIRGQITSLLFLTCSLAIVKKYSKGKKNILFVLTPLFFIWSNFHVQFFLGFVVITLYLLIDIYNKYAHSKKTYWRNIFLVLLSSFIATLFNPRGIDIITELARHFNNPSQKAIVEWMPFKLYSSLWIQFVILNVIIQTSIVYILLKKKLFDYLPFIGIVTALLIPTWWMRRYAWSLAITSLFFLIPVFKNTKLDGIKYYVVRITGILFFIVFSCWIFFFALPQENIFAMSWDRYCKETVRCSRESAELLKENLHKGKLWTYYGYGGWLIWNYPDIKPSIDGRMPSWIDEAGYSPFLEYFDQEQGITDINKSDYNIIYTITTKPIYKKLLKLESENKWDEIYEDEYSAVFLRIPSQSNTN